MDTSLLSSDEPSSKRRKVRKGTRSCWECKRRKVRCIFSMEADTVCIACKKRRKICVSQLEEDRSVEAPGSHIEDKLHRMEALIGQLVKNAAISRESEDISGVGSQQRDASVDIPVWMTPESDRLHLDQEASSAGSISSARSFHEPSINYSVDLGVHGDYSAPTRSDINTMASLHDDTIEKKSLDTRTHPSETHRTPQQPSACSIAHIDSNRTTKYKELATSLCAVWPQQSDLELICTMPVGISAYLHTGIRYPCSIDAENNSAPPGFLRLPPPDSHPIMIAKKLLTLATYLQGILPSALHQLGHLRESYTDMMSSLADTANRLVLSNDELVTSVEGIECIMIESLYHNYMGNLRKSWMSSRRAITIAQIMGLHRGLNPALKFVDKATRLDFDPAHMFFRLIQMDRYLSTMLSLPQAISDNPFASPKDMENCSPLSRMQRLYVVAAGRMLERNHTDPNDLSETQEIDKLLQRAAAEMPPKWWLMPNFSSTTSPPDPVHDTLRVNEQFTYYHLLTRLHLPYILRPCTDRRFDASKIAAVNASRELLARYLAFRGSNPGQYYCRGGDFLAFISSAVLCLAHTNAHCRRSSTEGTSVFEFIAHQRLSDRGMMESVLEIMDAGHDVISTRISSILKHLLLIESNAASGMYYKTGSSPCSEQQREPECLGEVSNGGKTLLVYIPHFGSINFETAEVVAAEKAGVSSEQSAFRAEQTSACEMRQQATFHSLEAGLERSSAMQGPLDHSMQGDSLQQIYATGESGISDPSDGSMPTGESYDWDLQGVDMAFFESLFRGTGMPDMIEDGTSWM